MKKLFYVCVALFAICLSCDEVDLKAPLKVISITPENNANSASSDVIIIVKFNRMISDVQGNFNGIVLAKSSGEIVIATKKIDEYNLSISIRPTEKLKCGETYTLKVEDIVSGDGEISEAFSSTFTTGVELASCSVIDGSKNVENLSNIILTFDRTIQKTLKNFSAINLVDSKLKPVDGILKFVSDDAKMVTIEFPEYLLDPGASYQITVKDVMAEDGFIINNPNIEFTVKDEPFAIVSITPENGSNNVPLDAKVVVIFNKKLQDYGLPYFTLIGSCGETWTMTPVLPKTIIFTCDTLLTNNISYRLFEFGNTVSVTGEVLGALPPYSFTVVANNL
jgi:hypothetical protein